MWIAMLLVLHIILGIVFTGEPDPCLESVYSTLDEPQRSVNYTAHVTETLMCDNKLTKKWYRFTSDSRITMPDTCVPLFKCGTRMPIWLSGGHPTVIEGIVDRTLCIHYDPTLTDPTLENECCGYEMTTRVKNCSQFFVYELDQVPECPMAYCAGDGQPCPKGQSGLTPNCTDIYPMLADRPLLKGPSIEGDNFYFYCEFHTTKSYNYQKFDVKWTFNNKILPNSEVTTNETSVKLNGLLLKGYLQSTVGCSVKSYFAITPENASDWIDSSNTYSAEVKIEPSYLVVSEAEEEKTISVKFTLPIVCQKSCDPLKLTLKQSGAKGTVSDQCMFSVYPADWNATTNEARLSLIVKAKRDHIKNDPNRRDMLALEVVNYGGVYNGTIIDPMPVQVLDKEERKCYIWGDPHIKGMEYNKSEYFHLYKTGDYTLYENKNRYFEIQIRTFICNHERPDRSVTCICAVAIREFNDLVIIDNCDFLNISLCGRSPTIKKFKKSNPATSVQMRPDGMEFGVYLPSGTEVKIQQSTCWLDVNVIIPSVDNGSGRGICGTFDGVPNNEFIYRNSTLQETCDNSNSECNPESFLESWRNEGVKSLFRVEPGKVTDNRTHVSCSCDANNGAQCSVRRDIPNKILPCTGNCSIVVSHRRKKKSTDESVSMDQLSDYSNPFDPDKSEDFIRANVNWPTPSGITEQEAESRCRSAIQTSQLWSLCNTMITIDSDYLEGCKLDIKYTDSFGAMETYINGFTTECQYKVATNSSNYIVDANGENVLKAEFAVVHEVCTLECLKNGGCQQGVCVCNSSFTGSNCQLSKEQGPQLREIYGSNSSSGVCDRSKNPCRRTFITASNYEYSDNLACKVQDLSTSTTTVEDAEYINNEIVACTLPVTRTTTDCSTINFAISVTMDGVLYGNSVNLRVFSSDCDVLFINAAPEIFQNPLLIALFVFLFLKRFL